MRQQQIPGRSRALLLWGILIVLAAPHVAAQKRPITHDVYASWRSIQGTQLSRDGAWLVYALVPQEGDGELVARNLKTNDEHRHARGRNPVITSDGRFAVFAIAPAKADMDKAKKEKKKPEEQPKSGMGIMNLATGEVVTVERVKSFRVPERGGAFLAYLLEPPLKKPEGKPADGEKQVEAKPQAEKPEAKPAEEGRAPSDKRADEKEKKKDLGTELVLRELATGKQTTIPEVVEYAWNEPGTWLAYSVSSKTPGQDGVHARRTADGTTRALATGLGNYKSLTFDEAGGQLAFLTDRADYRAETPVFTLFHWTDTVEAATELVSAMTPGVPAGMVVSENSTLQFSKDGERLFLATAPAPKPKPKDAPEPVAVDIWHWKDPDLQPMQKVRAEGEKKRSFQAVVHLKERRFVQLASAEMPSISLSHDARHALGTSNLAYRQLVSWEDSYNDVYAVDLWSGGRSKLLAKSPWGASLSPGGNYLLYFADGEWFAKRIADGRAVNLTGKLPVKFEDERWDTPGPPRPYGSAGWTEGDRSVLLYDRYDIWEVRPDGTGARNVTDAVGRARQLVFRYQRLDPDERTIPAARTLLLATTDDRSKATGYYRVSLAAAGGWGLGVRGRSRPDRSGKTHLPVSNPQPPAPNPLKPVVMLDKAFGGLQKAKDADTLVFTLQRFEEFPDLWVSDGEFRGMRKVSHANPQQARYLWGRSQLIDYRNADGKPLRAILTVPEDFDPSRKYPMMVYIYERLSDGLHRHVAPGPGTGINITRYVSNGYVVLQPDIIYQVGYPGESAMKCVVPAVRKVLDMGFVDAKRVGIQGHSWGGYQISYMVTRTNLFRAVQAGASVVNMLSAYGGIRWGTGMSRAFQYERTQSRIGAPPWERPALFLENSPILRVHKVETPYLTIHNDQDGAVPWYQAIEFFTALRRLGKEAYLFNYNGEDHGLRDRENMKHWTVHMAEFFDHSLLGAPRPAWMERGVPYLERGTRDLTAVYRSPSEGGSSSGLTASRAEGATEEVKR